MKKIILGLVILVSLIGNSFAFNESSFKSKLRKISSQSAALTDLHFCILMSEGVEISKGIDGYLWNNMNCEDAVEDAKEVGCTDQEIKDQFIESLQKSTLSNLEKCARERIRNDEVSCSSLLSRADKLGLTRDDIDKELGVLRHFID